MSICINCNLALQGKGNLQCDCCQGSLHLGCTGLSESDFKLTRAKSRSLKLVCNACSNNITQFKNLKAIIDSVQSDLYNSIAKLRDELTAQIQAVKQNDKQQPLNSAESIFEEVCEEVHERDLRRKNLIIFGLNEQKDTSSETRISRDNEAVNGILSVVSPNNNATFTECTRLGRYNESNLRPRPVKVIFHHEIDVIKCIRNVKKLKSSEHFQNISISFDRTPRQLNLYKQLKHEMDERARNGETNLKIKYVNGIPKIIRLN